MRKSDTRHKHEFIFLEKQIDKHLDSQTKASTLDMIMRGYDY